MGTNSTLPEFNYFYHVVVMCASIGRTKGCRLLNGTNWSAALTTFLPPTWGLGAGESNRYETLYVLGLNVWDGDKALIGQVITASSEKP